MAAPARFTPSFSNGRRWLHWLSTVLGVAAALALVVLVNYLAAGHFRRVQVDRNSAFKLSAQTQHVLEALTNDVNITIFFSPHGKEEEIYALSSALLTEYQQTCPAHIRVKTLNYVLEAGAAKDFLSKYNLASASEKDFIHFESGGFTKVVFAKELAHYDMRDLIAGRSKFVRRDAFLGEIFFTKSIYDVSNPQQLKAYFLYGHGENDPEDAKANNGYSKLAAMLKSDDNCDWAKLSLAGTNAIPADCALLIVAASAREGKMLPDELAKISAYLKQGGRMLALLTVRSGLESVLGNWGVGLGGDDNRVMDLNKTFMIGDGTFLTARLGTHPIMDPLTSEKMPLEMIFPREVYELAGQSKIPGAPQITILTWTSEQGMNESKHTSSFSLLAAVEQGSIQGVNSASGRGTRMVVAGDSYFLDDQVIESVGNRLFAHQALGWLLQQPQVMLSGLGPRAITEYKLYMTQSQARALRWLFLAGMPGAILLLGGLVWLRRRS